jgi:hypothetical protein
MISYVTLGKLVRAAHGARCNEDLLLDFRYDQEVDPFAVEMIVQADFLEHPITWRFARELFVQATNTTTPVGLGDVRLRVAGDRVVMRLESPDGMAEMTIPVESVRGFLAETTEEAAMPQQAVEKAIDSFLKEMLG